jgi:hypothetical protein
VLGGGVEVPQHRDHFITHARAREARIDVGAVLHPVEPPLAAVLPCLLPGDLEQRAHQATAPRRHAQQGAPAGRNRQAVQNGLSLIAGSVARGVLAARRVALGQRVAQLTRFGLQVAEAGQRHLLHRQRHAEPLAQRPAELGVGVGLGAQPVVRVQRADTRP